MFTYYTIIGKDLNLLKGHTKNVKEYAGFDKLTCEKEFLVIVYKNKNIPEYITQEILNWCSENDIRTYVYEEPNDVFLTNLYACWNLGYEQAKDGWVFRGGSDQVFSKDSFLHLYRLAEETKDKKYILQVNTIENRERLKIMGVTSRHLTMNFGNNFKDFKFNHFEFYVNHINKKIKKELLTFKDSINAWNKPTKFESSLGIIDRVDGVSWLMKREDWIKYGPLPPIEKGITGDIIIHDRLQTAGYEEFIVRDCVSYHFVQGESKWS